LGSIAGETPVIVAQAQCGFCAPPEDANAFAEVVRTFIAANNQAAMGENAKRYYQAHFTKQGHMDKLEAMLLELCGGCK